MQKLIGLALGLSALAAAPTFFGSGDIRGHGGDLPR